MDNKEIAIIFDRMADLMKYGVLTARRGWVTADDVINAWPATKMKAWLDSKR